MHDGTAVDVDRLRVFLSIVDRGGFAAAAADLGMADSAVAQAIRELESATGATLFNRIGRAVSLTFAGESLLPTARRALRGVANESDDHGDEDGHVSGRLDLACLPTLAVAPVAPLVGAFRIVHPGVSFVFADPQDTAELLSFIRSGLCELGISNLATAEDLITIQLGDQDFCVVLPPDTRTADPIPIELLAEMPLIATPRGSSTRALLDDVLGRLGASAGIVVETAQREAILPLIAAGAGSALLPRPLADAARRLGCVVAEPVPTVTRPVSIVHGQAPLTRAARRFIEFASAR